MALMSESLERLQSHTQYLPAVRGDAAWAREQLRVNSLRLAELEKLGVALETLRGQGAELLATVQTCSSQGTAGGPCVTGGCVEELSPACHRSPIARSLTGPQHAGHPSSRHPALGALEACWRPDACGAQPSPPSLVAAVQERVEQLLQQWTVLWTQGEERESWLQGLLVLADRFWDGLSDLALTLSDTQQAVLDLEEAPWDAEATQAQLGAMQVPGCAQGGWGQCPTAAIMASPCGALGTVAWRGGGAVAPHLSLSRSWLSGPGFATASRIAALVSVPGKAEEARPPGFLGVGSVGPPARWCFGSRG